MTAAANFEGRSMRRKYIIINIEEQYAKKVFKILKRGQIKKGLWPEGNISFDQWKKTEFPERRIGDDENIDEFCDWVANKLGVFGCGNSNNNGNYYHINCNQNNIYNCRICFISELQQRIEKVFKNEIMNL